MEQKILQHLSDYLVKEDNQDIFTCTVESKNIIHVMSTLKYNKDLLFKQLTDICAVDYMQYGQAEWTTTDATSTGYSRGVKSQSHGRIKFSNDIEDERMTNRFCIVYHLLSISNNFRIRIKTHIKSDIPSIPSITSIWDAADWYEREAYDLFGISFDGHPDLRRILTDYGFIGHPFRKDFPLIGNTQVRYDPESKKIIYEPVDIEPRVLVPKVIREK
ncbi:MAG: NADH-quinone oxidoreductase subunit C [Gammaproteobacteria bacterium]|nr:NADH-quinone oxidoreductase subunit C [Gammaproteobacteria bacterium]|tara:strand:+ start:667 stop:1317 length:651 start_codon:yes stop_codon:yes gene_type:complete